MFFHNTFRRSYLLLISIEFFWILKTDEKAPALRMQLLKSEETRRKRGEFRLCDNRPFWGIISHLSEKCGGNVHTKGVVNITSSSTGHGECQQVTDYEGHGWWCTKDEPNSWICFDFIENAVSLTGYSLSSDRDVQWVIEGSKDGSSWKELDSRKMQHATGIDTITYDCESGITESYRYFRLRQTGNNRYRGDCLFVSKIEFFGKLVPGGKTGV